MSRIVEIRIAELFAGKSGEIILTTGIGSCVVIVLYDTLQRLGGMSHAILPRYAPGIGEEKETAGPDEVGRYVSRYADQSVDMLVAQIEALGGARTHMVAKLIGGAHMFFLLEGADGSIGLENILAARDRLRSYNIPIESEVVGGTVGRNARFDSTTGIVEIVTKV